MDWRTAAIGVARIGMAWIFLWPFFDKLLGLGFSTARENAWIRGGSPTIGFLQFGSDPSGPLHGMFTAMAGHPVVDALFMLGLLGIGLALALGIGMRVACASGIALFLLMWLAIMPMDRGTDHNPFWDEHLQYSALLALLFVVDAGRHWGLGERWARLPLVQRHAWLR